MGSTTALRRRFSRMDAPPHSWVASWAENMLIGGGIVRVGGHVLRILIHGPTRRNVVALIWDVAIEGQGNKSNRWLKEAASDVIALRVVYDVVDHEVDCDVFDHSVVCHVIAHSVVCDDITHWGVNYVIDNRVVCDIIDHKSGM